MANSLPSLSGLRAFEAVARHLSFTRAAAELHVTQTAVSHQIRRLEAELGVSLFLRRARTVALTREGEELLPPVRGAFEDLRAATARLRRPHRGRILTISATPSLAAKWLVPRLGAFQQAHPGIEVRISTTMRLVDFAREEIDMAIRYGSGNWPGLRADWLLTEDIFPVCSPALLRGDKPLAQPADLARHTLLHVTTQADEWTLWLTAAGLRLDPTRRSLTFDLALMAYQAAMDGLGVALGHTPLVEADLAAGRLVAPFQLTLPSETGFYVVAPHGSADIPEIALFRTWLLRNAGAPQAAAPQPTAPQSTA